jgi:hypothetical protein
MDNRVLVIGPNYFNYLKASASAFERCGYTVVTDAYDTPVHPYTTIKAILDLWYRVSDVEGLLLRLTA